MTKRQRCGIAIATAFVILLAACDRSPRTFIEVSVDGVEYRIASGALLLFGHPNGETFLDLGPDIRRASFVTGVPNVGIQWRMPLGEPAELVGRSIDLPDPSLHGLSAFRFSEDFAVVSLERPQRVTVDIDRVERSVVEGRFRAERFVPVESEDEPPSPVHLVLVDLAVGLGGRDHGPKGEPFAFLGGDGRDVGLRRCGACSKVAARSGLAAPASVLCRGQRQGAEDRHGAAQHRLERPQDLLEALAALGDVVGAGADVRLGLALSGDDLFEQLAEDVSEAHDQPLLWVRRYAARCEPKHGFCGGTGTPLVSCAARFDAIDPLNAEVASQSPQLRAPTITARGAHVAHSERRATGTTR